METSFLQVRELSKSFPSSGMVLQSISFEIQLGTRMAIIGPSGCGKSTLIRLLADLEPLENSCFFKDGQRLKCLKDLGTLSFVFQESNLLPWRNVLENIRLPLELENEKIDPHRILNAIAKVGLQGFEKHFPDQLSGGMKMRVALARALITDPNFILLDEPFGALDEFTRLKMGEQLLSLWAEKKPTTLLITHDIEEALFLSDKVLVLSGRPGTVLDVIDVQLPEHRELSIKDSSEFWTMRKKLSQLLRMVL